MILVYIRDEVALEDVLDFITGWLVANTRARSNNIPLGFGLGLVLRLGLRLV
jgi:hypothetical protein